MDSISTNQQIIDVEISSLLKWVGALPSYQTIPGSSGKKAKSPSKPCKDDFKSGQKLVQLLKDLDYFSFCKSSSAINILQVMKKYLKGKEGLDYTQVQVSFPDQVIYRVWVERGQEDDDNFRIGTVLRLLLSCAVASPVKDQVLKTIRNEMEGEDSQILTDMLAKTIGIVSSNDKAALDIKEDECQEISVADKLAEIKAENNAILTQNANFAQRNRNLQRMVFILRQQKHGSKDNKLLEAELAALERQMNNDALKYSRKEGQAKDLTLKIVKKSRTIGKTEMSLQSENKALKNQIKKLQDAIKGNNNATIGTNLEPGMSLSPSLSDNGSGFSRISRNSSTSFAQEDEHILEELLQQISLSYKNAHEQVNNFPNSDTEVIFKTKEIISGLEAEHVKVTQYIKTRREQRDGELASTSRMN